MARLRGEQGVKDTFLKAGEPPVAPPPARLSPPPLARACARVHVCEPAMPHSTPRQARGCRLALVVVALAACTRLASGQDAAARAGPPPSPSLARDRAAWLVDLVAACADRPAAFGCELWAECKV